MLSPQLAQGNATYKKPPVKLCQFPSMPQRTVDFKHDVHNSVFQRRIFGLQAHTPALVIQESEILNA